MLDTNKRIRKDLRLTHENFLKACAAEEGANAAYLGCELFSSRIIERPRLMVLSLDVDPGAFKGDPAPAPLPAEGEAPEVAIERPFRLDGEGYSSILPLDRPGDCSGAALALVRVFEGLGKMDILRTGTVWVNYNPFATGGYRFTNVVQFDDPTLRLKTILQELSPGFILCEGELAMSMLLAARTSGRKWLMARKDSVRETFIDDVPVLAYTTTDRDGIFNPDLLSLRLGYAMRSCLG
ncbi:MAG: hypothetical protein LBR22_04100 [Desulfovibrio sp.]|jgi:hypothetical protein|nr:hypothetical protein [Desulfovibrio sp.]